MFDTNACHCCWPFEGKLEGAPVTRRIGGRRKETKKKMSVMGIRTG